MRDFEKLASRGTETSFQKTPRRCNPSKTSSFRKLLLEIDTDTNKAADTIVALSTPRGYSGVGMIRLSGPDSASILRNVFKPAGNQSSFPDRRAVYGRVVDPETGAILDDGIAVFMRAPRSYTGEDMVELSLHGSPVVLDMVLKLVASQGARPANRGEFSLRAFLSGRMDLVQVEAVIDLIEAPGPIAAKEARSRLDGALSEEIHRISDAIKDIVAELEAHIDFDEDDEGPAPDPGPAVRQVLADMEELIRRSNRGRIRREGIKAVIIGKPNVGKSTLFNRLLGDDRAIVTPYPGTTRDTLEDSILLAGIAFHLHDTAGIRKDPEPIEKEGIRRSHEKIEQADLVIAVLDGSSPLSPYDSEVLKACNDKAGLLVINKKDLGLKIGMEEARELARGDRQCIALSAKTGEGVDELEELLSDMGKEMGDALLSSNVAGLNSRCTLLMEAALLPLRNLVEDLSRDVRLRPEIVSLELKRALAPMEEITGERVSEGILDRIFERFCVGK